MKKVRIKMHTNQDSKHKSVKSPWVTNQQYHQKCSISNLYAIFHDNIDSENYYYKPYCSGSELLVEYDCKKHS